MDTAIRFDAVTRDYGRQRALDRLDLAVPAGEIYGFIGPNGAGKSTTIRLLLGHIRAHSGTVRVLGLDPARDDLAIKRQAGYVASEAFLYPDMRVSELLDFTAHFHGVRVPARRTELVDTLEIDLHKRFEELSFGNRKKVAIACALLHSPRLIILDEPSNGLDPVIRARLYALLQAERQAGATIFFSSHVLGEVQRVCTRIGLIKEGRLLREAAAAEFADIGYRRVSLRTEAEPDLARLPGVADHHVEGGVHRFLYSGPADDLIRLLAGIPVQAIHIEEPDLEQVFMHYFSSPS